MLALRNKPEGEKTKPCNTPAITSIHLSRTQLQTWKLSHSARHTTEPQREPPSNDSPLKQKKESPPTPAETNERRKPCHDTCQLLQLQSLQRKKEPKRQKKKKNAYGSSHFEGPSPASSLAPRLCHSLRSSRGPLRTEEERTRGNERMRRISIKAKAGRRVAETGKTLPRSGLG